MISDLLNSKSMYNMFSAFDILLYRKETHKPQIIYFRYLDQM